MINHSRRIKKITNQFDRLRIDGFLVGNFYNLLYLLGFAGLAQDEREGWLLLAKNKGYFFIDGRYQFQWIGGKEYLVETVLIQSATDLLEKLKKIIVDEGIKKLGLEKEDLKLGEYLVFKEKLAGIDLEPLPMVVAQIRQIKDEQEIEAIKKACEVTDASLDWLRKNIEKGQREKEIAWMIEKWIKEKGMDFSFYPIVAIDENSAVAHYDTKRDGEKKVFDNCTILVDMGVKVDDYCSDITRVFFFGKPKNEQFAIYQKLLQTQKKTIEAIKPAILASQIDQFCRSLLEPLAFYPHSTGHGIGLEVHEFPKISSQSKTAIEPGMVFTIEPGIYIKDQFGIRIEDTVLVEADGTKTLTNFSKEIIVI